jgi:hypothetical protein
MTEAVLKAGFKGFRDERLERMGHVGFSKNT